MKKKYKYAFTSCEACLEFVKNGTQEQGIDYFLTYQFNKCPFGGKPPLHIPIRVKYKLHCFNCQGLIACPAETYKHCGWVFCGGCYAYEDEQNTAEEEFQRKYDAECEKVGMDSPEYEIKEYYKKMERNERYE